MDQIVMFVRETGKINVPNPPELNVMERVLDIYDKTTRAYLLDGDGVLDADNDSINGGIAP
jgi:hypothetical protein